MKPLIDWVHEGRARTESYFVQALMSEDIERLTTLDARLAAAGSLDAFRKVALYAGWSKDDTRTHELLPKLEPLIETLWAHRNGTASDHALIEAWAAFHDLRIERLVGCLSRTPKLPL